MPKFRPIWGSFTRSVAQKFSQRSVAAVQGRVDTGHSVSDVLVEDQRDFQPLQRVLLLVRGLGDAKFNLLRFGNV